MTEFILINNTIVDEDVITVTKVPTIVNTKNISCVEPVTKFTTIEGISISKHPDIKSIIKLTPSGKCIFSELPFEKFIKILSAR